MKRIFALLLLWFMMEGVVRAAMSDSITITCVVNKGVSTLNVQPRMAEWDGYVTATRWRFNSNIMTCRFFGANAGWKIRVYHTNGVSSQAIRGRAVDPNSGKLVTNSLPVRMWQPDYGPANYYAQGLMPDPMNNGFYNGGFAPYISHQGNATLASAAWQDASPLRFNLMVDAQTGYETLYSGDIFFELYYP